MPETVTETYIARAERALQAELEVRDPLLRALYTLLVLTTGKETSLADVHDAWAVFRQITKPEHKDLVPFAALEPEVKAKDMPFQRAIVRAALRLASEG